MSKWDNRFIELAKQISTWSKDPSSQIGAVAVDDSRRILSVGYNGFPRGLDDSPEKYFGRDYKYPRIVHAEMNCIFNAAHHGISLDGSTLYVYGLPVCNDCAKGLIQVGVKRIVVKELDTWSEKWKGPWEISQDMFKEAGITINIIKDESSSN